MSVPCVRFSRPIDDRKPGVQMARILQYLECPQYLRKSFFPQHKDLEYAGWLVASLSNFITSHHLHCNKPVLL